MKTWQLIVLLIVIGVVIGTAYLLLRGPQTPAPAPAAEQTTSAAPAEAAQSAPVTQPATMGTAADATVNAAAQTSTAVPAATGQVTTPTAKHFTVNGNDQSADVTSISVKKGTPVTITFGADAGSTYHGGLDFRSSVVSTGTVAPGTTKTVSFTADHSFSFTPYWPATNIAKPYSITVTVSS